VSGKRTNPEDSGAASLCASGTAWIAIYASMFMVASEQEEVSSVEFRHQDCGVLSLLSYVTHLASPPVALRGQLAFLDEETQAFAARCGWVKPADWAAVARKLCRTASQDDDFVKAMRTFYGRPSDKPDILQLLVYATQVAKHAGEKGFGRNDRALLRQAAKLFESAGKEPERVK